MAAIYKTLPTELWGLIFSNLLLPDLEAANLTSKYFHAVVQNCLQTHRELKRQASTFKADRGEDILAPWLEPLLQVLRDSTFASYVRELDTFAHYEDICYTCSQLDRHCGKTASDILPAADYAILQRGARTCFADWFDLPEHPEYREFFFGEVDLLDQSALLAILICNLPNLKVLTLTTQYWGGLRELKWLERLVDRIHLRQDTPLLGNKPLSSLEHLKGDIYDDNRGLDFHSIAPFIALPSLRWLETPCNGGDLFDWPEDLPRSNVREIVLDQSSVPEYAIRQFAAQALKGPCVIRQAFRERWIFNNLGPTWNRLEVPFEGAKAKDHLVEFREHGDPYSVPPDEGTWYSNIGWEVRGGGKLVGKRPMQSKDDSSHWINPAN